MDQQKIGSFIAELRHEKGLTQEQLAQKLAVSNKTVSRWETGKYMPDISMLQELAALLDISINELLSGERIMNTDEFVQKSDENLLEVMSAESAFGLKDKIAYFKHKWLQEHILLIAAAIMLGCIAFFFLLCFEKTILIPVLAVLILIGYAYLRNKMMIYVEHRVFKEEL